MPASALQKAKDRAWIEFSSQIIMDQYRLSVAKSEAEFNAQKLAFLAKLKQLEQVVEGEYFNGEEFSLVDAAIAPVMTRIATFKKVLSVGLFTRYSKIGSA